ncbi:MAG: hypothetical protein WBM40_09325, partial [Thiohalocapsa sp.]
MSDPTDHRHGMTESPDATDGSDARPTSASSAVSADSPPNALPGSPESDGGGIAAARALTIQRIGLRHREFAVDLARLEEALGNICENVAELYQVSSDQQLRD